MRSPDFIIGPKESPYLLRWYLIPKNRFFNIYLHKFLKSDDDRALHDHPWPSIGMILKGKYIEHVPLYPERWRIYLDRRTKEIKRGPFCPVLRRAKHIHRIQLYNEFKYTVADYDAGIPEPPIETQWGPAPVWTIFITGPRVREWGFWCPWGFRHWKEFVSVREGGNDIGRGCE